MHKCMSTLSPSASLYRKTQFRETVSIIEYLKSTKKQDNEENNQVVVLGTHWNDGPNVNNSHRNENSHMQKYPFK